MSQISRTAKLWIQYYQQASLMCLYLLVKRTGVWDLHLYCVKEMLPHFYAAERLDVKSAHLYCNRWVNCQRGCLRMNWGNSHKGYFAVCRSNKPWTGVFSVNRTESHEVLLLAMVSHRVHQLNGCLPSPDVFQHEMLVIAQNSTKISAVLVKGKIVKTFALSLNGWRHTHPLLSENHMNWFLWHLGSVQIVLWIVKLSALERKQWRRWWVQVEPFLLWCSIAKTKSSPLLMWKTW